MLESWKSPGNLFLKFRVQTLPQSNKFVTDVENKATGV